MADSNSPTGIDTSDTTLVRVLNEVSSAPPLRQELMRKLADMTGRTPILYVSSFANHPMALINDWDAQTIENILRSYSKVDKLDLIIASPGGYAESAERIISAVYAYCHDLRVIIPTQAKSAATMVAMGASSIVMSKTSEIGPIDPQLGNGIAAQSVIKAYEQLQKQINDKAAKNESYDAELVSISKIDPILLRECQRAMDLAKDIALKLLRARMFKNKKISLEEIEALFVDDGQTFSHGRLIDYKKARSLGLNIVYSRPDAPEWNLIWEITIRGQVAVGQHNFAKLIESDQFSMQPGTIS